MTKPPTVQQLVDIIAQYNKAREHELQSIPKGMVVEGYKNPLMESLYDAACLAAQALKPAVELHIKPPK